MSFTWGKGYLKEMATNSVIRKTFASTSLNVLNNQSNVGIFPSSEDVECLLDELANFRAEGWSWQHSSCSGLMMLAAHNVLLVCYHVIAPSSNSKVEFQFQSVECHTNH